MPKVDCLGFGVQGLLTDTPDPSHFPGELRCSCQLLSIDVLCLGLFDRLLRKGGRRVTPDPSLTINQAFDQHGA